MVLNCSGRFFPNKYTVCLLYICGFPVCGTNHQELKFPSAIGWTWGCETCDYGETTAFIVLQHFMQEIWAPVDFSTCGGSGTIPKRWLCLIDQRMRILRGWKSWKLCLSQCISSVQCSRSVLSNFLRAHGLQHASFPVHHQLLELAQTHVHWIGDAIQPSHPLSSPSPLTFSLFQLQGLFQWVSSLHQVAKVLELQLQHQTFQCIFRIDFF